jgi:hypothetical protein
MLGMSPYRKKVLWTLISITAALLYKIIDFYEYVVTQTTPQEFFARNSAWTTWACDFLTIHKKRGVMIGVALTVALIFIWYGDSLSAYFLRKLAIGKLANVQNPAGSSNLVQIQNEGIEKAKQIRRFIQISKEIVKRGIPFPDGEKDTANIGVKLGPYLEQIGENSTDLMRFCQAISDWKTGLVDNVLEDQWRDLLPQLLRSANALENLKS